MTSFSTPEKQILPQILPVESDGRMCRGTGVKVRLAESQRKVFILLSMEGQKYSGSEIAVKLNIKKGTVYKAIKRLCVLGLISQEGETFPKSYVLTRAGRAEVSTVLVSYDESGRIFDRSHRWQFKIGVRSFPEVMPVGWVGWELNNVTISKKIVFAEGLEVEVRKNAERSLSISFSEVPGPDAQATEDRAFYVAYRSLDLIRAELRGADFGPAELLNVSLSNVHHTVTNDPYAQKCIDAKATINGRAHSVDASVGLPETEFDRLAPGVRRGLCQKYSSFIDAYCLGEVSPEGTQRAVGQVGAVLERLAPVLEREVEVSQLHSINILKHMDVLDQMKVTLQAIESSIREALPRRRRGVLSWLVGWLW